MAGAIKDPELVKENKSKWSKIQVHKSLRRSFTLLCCFGLLAMFLVFLQHQRLDLSWTQLLLPLFVVSLCLDLFPETEEWSYQPWQSKVEKVERYFVD